MATPLYGDPKSWKKFVVAILPHNICYERHTDDHIKQIIADVLNLSSDKVGITPRNKSIFQCLDQTDLKSIQARMKEDEKLGLARKKQQVEDNKKLMIEKAKIAAYVYIFIQYYFYCFIDCFQLFSYRLFDFSMILIVFFFLSFLKITTLFYFYCSLLLLLLFFSSLSSNNLYNLLRSIIVQYTFNQLHIFNLHIFKFTYISIYIYIHFF